MAKWKEIPLGKVKDYFVTDEPRNIDCPECKGEGTATYERMVPQGFNTPYPYPEEYQGQCENCSGSGSIEADDEDE